MNGTAPRLSAVVATYNRRQLLAKALAALDRQTLPQDRFEVIVVDDGSTDGTAEWVAEQAFAMSCRLIRQGNQGASAARNAGIEAARGDVVLFLDDDFVPGAHLLEEHLKIHESDSRVAVIGPTPSLTRYGEPWIAWQQATMERTYDAMARGVCEPSFREFWSGNCSVGREHVEAVGGFDVSLRAYEDVELGYRLMRHGLRFRFNAKATGLHYSSRSFDRWCETTRDYAPFSIRLFRRLGDERMRELLAGDWAARHRLTRWLVRQTVGRNGRVAAAATVLTLGIRLGSLAPMSRFSHAVCAAMANLFYWDGVAKELGCGDALDRWLVAAPTGPGSRA